jgi:hypothetical protein
VSDTAWGYLNTSWQIGFNDRSTEGDWVWSNGDDVTYTNWASGEPNDSGGEDCVQILWSGYAWNDGACGSALPYICEAAP